MFRFQRRAQKSTVWARVRTSSIVLLSLSLVAVVWNSRSAHAANAWYVAPTGSDIHACTAPATPCLTIQAAIGKAASGDTIDVAAGTYTENVRVLDKNLSLVGAGSAQTIIRDPDAQATGNAPVGINRTVTISGFTLRDGNVGLSIGFDGVVTGTDLVITDNNRPTGFSGRGVVNDGRTILRASRIQNHASRHGSGVYNNGDLTLQDVVITNNTAEESGAGIYHAEYSIPDVPDPLLASLRLTKVTILNNRLELNPDDRVTRGGGIYSTAPITIELSLIQGNTAMDGGGIFSRNSALSISDSVFLDNQADIGGAILSGFDSLYAQGQFSLTNATLSSNATETGAALAHGDVRNVPASVTNTTIVGNTGIAVSTSSAVQFKNTIIASSSVTNCDSPPVTSLGNNIDSGSSCGLSGPGDRANTNPKLGPLQNNGGPWPTHALLAGSPAIDSGTNNGCPVADARGTVRPFDGDGNGSALCDVGAYEFGAAVPSPSPGTRQRLFLPFTGR